MRASTMCALVHSCTLVGRMRVYAWGGALGAGAHAGDARGTCLGAGAFFGEGEPARGVWKVAVAQLGRHKPFRRCS